MNGRPITHEPTTEGTFDLAAQSEDFRRGYALRDLQSGPPSTWRGVCGHLWDRRVEDTMECPRCTLAARVKELEEAAKAALGDEWQHDPDSSERYCYDCNRQESEGHRWGCKRGAFFESLANSSSTEDPKDAQIAALVEALKGFRWGTAGELRNLDPNVWCWCERRGWDDARHSAACVAAHAVLSNLTAAANQHDERVRAAERERLRKAVVFPLARWLAKSGWVRWDHAVAEVEAELLGDETELSALLSEEAPNAE